MNNPRAKSKNQIARDRVQPVAHSNQKSIVQSVETGDHFLRQRSRRYDVLAGHNILAHRENALDRAIKARDVKRDPIKADPNLKVEPHVKIEPGVEEVAPVKQELCIKQEPAWD